MRRVTLFDAQIVAELGEYAALVRTVHGRLQEGLETFGALLCSLVELFGVPTRSDKAFAEVEHAGLLVDALRALQSVLSSTNTAVKRAVADVGCRVCLQRSIHAHLFGIAGA